MNIVINSILSKANEYIRDEKEHNDRAFVGPMYQSVSEEEGRLLYSITRRVKPYIAIETGTGIGYSAIHIGQALKDNGRGSLITCEADIGQFSAIEKNVKRSNLDKYIHCLNCKGVELADLYDLPCVGLVFLDSDHSYENVKKEFEVFSNMLSSSGMIIMHDVLEKEVGEFFREIKGWWKILLPTEYGLGLVSKKDIHNVAFSNRA